MMEKLQPIDNPEELLERPNHRSAAFASQDSSLDLPSESSDGDRADSRDDLFLDYYANFIGMAQDDQLAWRTQASKNSQDI